MTTYGTGVYGAGIYGDPGSVATGHGLALRVREKPPLRVSYDIETPGGRFYRWAADEPDAANVPAGARWSDTMPGGFELFDATLPRKPGTDYADLERLSTITVRNAGGGIIGEYRLERAPSSSGDEMAVSPVASGWQAALADDESAQELFVDRLASRWQTAPVDRQAEIAAGGLSQGKIQASTDGGGIVWNVPDEDIPASEHAEMWLLNPAGIAIRHVHYKADRDGSFTNFASPSFFNLEGLTAASGYEEVAATFDDTLRTLTFTDARRNAMTRLFTTGAAASATGRQQRVLKVAVYGDHGLTLYDLESGEPAGVLASDVVAYAVGRWAPMLRYTAGATIQASASVIPQAAYLTPTTAAEIVRDMTKYELQDWAVWDNRTFYWAPPGTFGRNWRARVAPSGLEEAGPQADRLWESVIVEYRDSDDVARTVGPVGSGMDTETDDLRDDDPENPANKLGITRRARLSANVTTATTATTIGRTFLEQSKLLDTSGRATIYGYVEDDRGVTWPYHAVRAGDTIAFVDAADSSPRRVVKTSKDADARTCSVDLDAPPDGLSALLQRLDAGLV